MTEVSEDSANGRAPVRVLQVPDPAAAAAGLRDEGSTDLAADLTTAEAEVRRRVEADRRAHRLDAKSDEADLLARAVAIRAAAAELPPISDDDVAELERLAGDLARASRIRSRTEARFTENLEAKLAVSSGIALHPGAIKEAAEAVVVAERVLADAEAALAAHQPLPLPGSSEADAAPPWQLGDYENADGEDPVLSKPHDDFDEVALDRRRALTRGVAVFLVLAGLGVIALGLDLSPVIAGVLVLLGLVVAIVTIRRGRRAADELAATTAQGTARLALLPDANDYYTDLRVPEGDPEAVADPPEEDEDELDEEGHWLAEHLDLDAARDEADEQLRMSRRRWHQLAGMDADPHDAESVIRAHDPQLAFDKRVALASPTVRTVAAFHRRAKARWKVLWAALGHDEPPAVEDLDATLDAILGDHRRHRRELQQLEAVEARWQAEAVARRPLALVEPKTWVSATRLGQLISSIPSQGEVIVVEREAPSAPEPEGQPIS